ncbi:MAG: hypothetical protein M1834_004783 [Cirrosporium novae-zelandiae]|nr:MAG: hypothetical protein M1834_004783 [Cirrosporium novae-zelandiae]
MANMDDEEKQQNATPSIGDRSPLAVSEDESSSSDEEQETGMHLHAVQSNISNLSNIRPSCFRSTAEEILFVLTVTLANAMSSILAGVCVVVTAQIGADLNMTQAEITWIVSSSALTSGTFLLQFGRIADMYGRKWLIVGSLGGFAIFSFVTGFANNAMYMDILNGVMGLLSASVVPPAIGSLGSIYPHPSRRKNAAFACFSAGNPVGFVVGSFTSGVCTQIFSWRASFYFLAIVYALLTIAAMVTVPKDDGNYEKFSMESVKKFDLVGTVLSLAGLALFSASLSLAGDAPEGWSTPYVIALLVVGFVLICAFVYWESIFEYPLMPLWIWKDRNFSLIVGVLCMGFAAFQPGQFWLSLYMQKGLNWSALSVAIHLLPQVVMGILVNIIAAFIMHRVSNKILHLIGAIGYTLAYLLLGLVGVVGWHYWSLAFISLMLCVVGADFEFNVANMYVMSSMPRDQQSVAGGVFNTVTKLSYTVGLGLSTAIYNAVDAKGGDPLDAYAASWWFSTAIAGASILLIPFITIGTQGTREKRKPAESEITTAVNTRQPSRSDQDKESELGAGEARSSQEKDEKSEKAQ